MDVNEKIVICWLQKCKNIFTIDDVEYDKFHSSIDILGLDINAKEILDIEVKFKARIKIDESDNKQNGYQHIKKQLFSVDRQKAIKKLLLNKNDFKIVKVFITTKRFMTVGKFDYWMQRFQKDKIRVLFFDDILKDLGLMASKLNKANDEILQTLRIYDQFRKFTDTE